MTTDAPALPRSPYAPYVNRGMYVFIRGLAALLFHTIWRLRIHGRENIPATGALIAAPNHRSYFDPPLTGVAVTRPVHFLAKKELFEFRPFGWFITQLNAHPLNRAGDIAAFREAARILKAGGGIIIFPEGRRMDSEVIGQAKAGLGMLAATTGAKILPIYIRNSRRMVLLARVDVYIGRAIDPANFSSYNEIASHWMNEIAALRDARPA